MVNAEKNNYNIVEFNGGLNTTKTDSIIRNDQKITLVRKFIDYWKKHT